MSLWTDLKSVFKDVGDIGKDDIAQPVVNVSKTVVDDTRKGVSVAVEQVGVGLNHAGDAIEDAGETVEHAGSAIHPHALALTFADHCSEPVEVEEHEECKTYEQGLSDGASRVASLNHDALQLREQQGFDKGFQHAKAIQQTVDSMMHQSAQIEVHQRGATVKTANITLHVHYPEADRVEFRQIAPDEFKLVGVHKVAATAPKAKAKAKKK